MSINGLQRTAQRLRTHMKYWLQHQLRARDRRAAAEAGCSATIETEAASDEYTPWSIEGDNRT